MQKQNQSKTSMELTCCFSQSAHLWCRLLLLAFAKKWHFCLTLSNSECVPTLTMRKQSSCRVFARFFKVAFVSISWQSQCFGLLHEKFPRCVVSNLILIIHWFTFAMPIQGLFCYTSFGISLSLLSCPLFCQTIFCTVLNKVCKQISEL